MLRCIVELSGCWQFEGSWCLLWLLDTWR